MERHQLPTNAIPEHYDLFIRPDREFFVSSDLIRRFDGSILIKIEVNEPTSEITLNAVELQLHHAVLDGDQNAAIILNEPDQTATLVFERSIAAGAHVLSIEYSGKIYLGAQGMFVSEYDTAEGRRRLLLTQFEAGDARRFIPCWDEPARKATFTVAVAAPKDKLVVSNMPIETVSELDDKHQYVRFRTTPKMSSYLLFLCVGDLERVSAISGATIISVIAKKGSAKEGAFALDSAVKLLSFYNEFFGVPYALPKLDMIAAPGAGGFSAMENWGAILYFEDQLLLNREWSTESNRQRVFVVVAHEMAHQWFGNLVTMDWWDDLWLNEGFASWMESTGTDHFNEDWKNWLQSEFDLQRAMQQDAKRTTHPIVQPVVSVEQAAFDDITYRKGRAVIRMVESYIGPPAFQAGVQAYMKRYAYKNTVTDNLWDELERASGKKIKELIGDFTTKPGIPLIIVDNVVPGTGSVTANVRQKRFGVDESANEPTDWSVPVYAFTVGSAQNQVLAYVKGDNATAIAVPGSAAVKLNANQTVYYRVRYGGVFAELVKAFDRLDPPDQLGLLNDAWALGEAGVAPISDYLDLTLKLKPGTDPVVCRHVVETLLEINSLYGPGTAGDVLRDYARKLLQPVLTSIGWDWKEGERSNDTVLREYLIAGLAQLGDQGVKAEAERRFKAYAGPPVRPDSLPAVIRRPVIQAAAINASNQLYDAIYQVGKNTRDSVGKDQVFVALAWAAAAPLAQRSLDIALGDDPAKTTGPKMIQRVAISNPDLAWQFALANLDKITERLDEQQRFKFVPGLTATSRSAEALGNLQRYIADKVPPLARKSVERFVADLKFRLQVIEQRLPDIGKWLASQQRG